MKFLYAKRGTIFVLLAIIIAGAALGVTTSAVSAFSPSETVVVIDAGHGGIDSGVVGVYSRTKESDINLAIARFLRGYFAEAGFCAVMTRNSNGGLYGLPTSGFKKRDMKKRRDIIQSCNADMVISVHQNSCPIPSRRGGQVFYDKSSSCGKALAESIQNSLNSMENCPRKSSALTGDYYMLKCTDNPSVIVECGFLTNSEDDRLLNTEQYQKEIAYAIFKGAVGYYA